jgi:uncharacterized protein YcfJ
METTTRLNRIHPLMATAAVSIILVSLAGVAAITGILPSSHGAPEAQPSAIPPATAALGYAPAPAGAPMAAPGDAQMATPVAAAYEQPAPAAEERAPAVKHTVQHHAVHHTTQLARNDEASNDQRPAPQPAAPQAAPSKPNYLGIGAGAVIGGLIGHQVGGGNGKKLATVAGVIGGGIIGNEVANRNK